MENAKIIFIQIDVLLGPVSIHAVSAFFFFIAVLQMPEI
jgi:hypothetical protein